jgi:predicted thioesterase
MDRIPIGLKHQIKRSVGDDIASNFMGLEGARVLGTPHLIRLLETAARDSLMPFLEAGYDTVGTEIHLRHLASTPMDMEVTFHSEVTAVDGRRVQFKVTAFNPLEKVAEGTHERFVVHVERLAKRLEEKKKSAAPEVRP